MEKIRAAAIKYKKKEEDRIRYVGGGCYADCLRAFFYMELYCTMRDMSAEKSGFLTTEGRFVDQVEAKQIAVNAGQISEKYQREKLYPGFIDWNA